MSPVRRKHIKYVYSAQLIKEADKNPVVEGRASLVHDLMRVCGLLEHLDIVCPKVCEVAALRSFHSGAYLKALAKCSCATSSDPESGDSDSSEAAEVFGLGYDCATWPGIEAYVRGIAGATIAACEELQKSTAGAPEVVVNWTGGWHHAHRDKAAGHCYVNDIVLGILALRRHYRRILYVDLDVHHGDGVQEAFETSKHVFTLSFHQFECGFYPGTGAATDCGAFTAGRGYSANFPYKSGISGPRFQTYVKRIIDAVLTAYEPECCVIQCGADAIVGDSSSETNLTPCDLIDCVQHVIARNLPTLLLGGGGYNLPNASRFWTLLTARLCDVVLEEEIPRDCLQYEEYGPYFYLRIQKQKFLKDSNSEAYLEECARTIEEHLKAHNVHAV